MVSYRTLDSDKCYGNTAVWVVVSFTLKKHSRSDLSQWSAFVLSSVTVFWLTFSCCDQTVTKRFLCLTHPDAEGSPDRSSNRSRGRTHAAYLLPGLCSAAFLIPSRTTCLWWAETEPAPTPINITTPGKKITTQTGSQANLLKGIPKLQPFLPRWL